MEFSNGFQEDDDPLPPPPVPVPSSTASSSRTTAIVDLTDSPPSASAVELDFDRAFSTPAVIPAPKSRFGQADVRASTSTSTHAGGMASGSRGVGQGSMGRGEGAASASAPFATGSGAGRGGRGGGFAVPSPSHAKNPYSSSSSSGGFSAFARPTTSSASGSSSSTLPSPAFSTHAAAPSFSNRLDPRSPASASPYTNQSIPRIGSSTSSFIPVTQQIQKPPQTFGSQIPLITSGATSRVPSAYLGANGNGSANGHQQQQLASGSLGMSTGGLQQQGYYSPSSSAPASSAQQLHYQAQQYRPPRPAASTSSYNTSTSSASLSKGKSKAPVIDLTTSDGDGSASSSDDVVIDDSPVCIGQLTSLALILYPVSELQPPPIPPSSNPQPLLPQPPLPVHIVRMYKQGVNETIKLYTPRSKEDFGVMEHKIANIIGPLMALGNVGIPSTGATGQQMIWCKGSVVRRGERNPMMLPLSLLLFVRPSNVPYVSSLLSSNAIYLEHPSAYNPAAHSNYRYSNPHNPAPGVSGRGEAERRRAALNAAIYGGTGGGMGASAGRGQSTVEVQRQQVEEVFRDLKSGVDVEEQEPDPMITTKLYPHQKQALSFLLDRERLIDIPPATASNPNSTEVVVSLWKRRANVYSTITGWKNLVTDLEIAGETPPPQSRGAILADDMGLGKTLVMISLVAATIGEAREWAKEAPKRDSVDERFAQGGGFKPGKNGKVRLEDFKTPLYGMDPRNVTKAEFGGDYAEKGMSKKKEAQAKREKERDDASSERFAKLRTRSRATLIVCPLSTVQNWESQFEEHVRRPDGGYEVRRKVEKEEEDDDEDEDAMFKIDVEKEREKDKLSKGKGKAKESASTSSSQSDRALTVYVYHGNTRHTDALKLADYDVVITTFSTLGTEYSKQARAEEERSADFLADETKEDTSDGELQWTDLQGNPVDPVANVVPKKRKRMRKKIQGDGRSPLQQIQWFRVVLDEAHIIKEHTTIQARAACDLSASRRTALSGTPLQNSLNDLFSLVRFLRLEPFTDRALWTQYIGALAKVADPLGVSRLQLIMRHLALRRTKASVDKDGKPILELPPNNQKVVKLKFDPAEHAFYSSHHSRYKHDFKKLEETDSVMKNYCSILQELLRLRQICVHMALVRDSEDLTSSNRGGGGGGGDGATGGEDLSKNIDKHGISKPRAIQLLGLMRDAGCAQCSECGLELVPASGVALNGVASNDALDEMELDTKKPIKKVRKTSKSTTVSAVQSEDESVGSARDREVKSIITKCQHVFCQACFKSRVCPGWPREVKSDDKAICTVCKGDLVPALDAVEVGAGEVDDAQEGDLLLAAAAGNGKKGKKTRVFEHSTKTKALIADVFPFSQANPASANFWGDLDLEEPKTEETGGTIGFQPVKGEVVKSVVFSQWTKLLDRLGDSLDHVNIKYGRLDGGMNRDQRTKAMDAFRLDPACEILLVSLRAGGVGLNLTAGRRVYLMEPFWNPAVENQAIDRCHRLGQTMPVQTVRFVIEKTIEESMLKIQKRKMDLANMSLSQTLSKAELVKRRHEDLRMLMDG